MAWPREDPLFLKWENDQEPFVFFHPLLMGGVMAEQPSDPLQSCPTFKSTPDI